SDVRGGSLPFHRPDVHHVGVTRQKMPWCLAAVTAAVFSSLFLIGGIAHAQTTPTLTASPSTVTAGNVVTFTGTGFNPSQTITLSSSGTGTSIASTTSDAAGAFSVLWTVPAGTAAGTDTITAADQGGLTASTTLTVSGSAAALYVSPSTVNAGDPVTFTARPAMASPLPATPVAQAVPSASGQVAFTGASTKSQSYTGLAAVAAGLLLLVIGRAARSRART